MEQLLASLRAAAEPTRLRLLALAARGAFCVVELTEILGQSQPRLSRHLKLLAEAGLPERARVASESFRRQGADWDEMRALGLDAPAVEAALLRLLPETGLGRVLDI